MKQLPHRFAEPLDRGNITSSPYLGGGWRPGVLSTKGVSEGRGYRSQKIAGFTLVELIVVITILAILSVVAFMQFSSFRGSARDGDRVTTLKNIEKGLDIFKLKSNIYPMPEWEVSQGVINGSTTVYAYKGLIADYVSRVIGISKTPLDPLSSSNYIYALSGDRKTYQVATVMENSVAFDIHPVLRTPLKRGMFSFTPSPSGRGLGWGLADWELGWGLIPTALAASQWYQARVNGNYPGYIKFSSGSEVWIANIPSLIWSNSGASVNLLSSGTYFVVNKQQNLPYKLSGDTITENVAADPLMQIIAKRSEATLTGVNVTNVSTAGQISSVFTGAVLASFGGVSGMDSTSPVGSSVIAMGNIITGASATTGGSYIPVYLNCSETSHSGYTIVPLAHATSITAMKAVDHGTGSLTATCTDGVLGYAPESVSCATWFVEGAGYTCIADVCGGTIADLNAHSTATSQTAGQNWTRSVTAGMCTWTCNDSYTWDSGSSSCKASCPVPATDTHSTQVYTLTSTGMLTDTQSGQLRTGNLAFGGAPANGTLSASFTYACANGVLSKTSANGSISCGANYAFNSNWSTPVCALDTYSVSGSFGANANGATINGCGTSATADGSGNFSLTNRSYGTACNNFTVTRTGYTCSVSTQWPASLVGAVSNVAGSCSVNTPYVDDVFSTYLYTGNGGSQTINNGIDLAGHGGMVWVKSRVNNTAAPQSYETNLLYDTIRGPGNSLRSNETTGAMGAGAFEVSTFNNNGFNLGANNNYNTNSTNSTYASWTFRKAPKFFDVVTFTADGAGGATFNHTLGTSPGMVVIKRTNGVEDWWVYHVSTGNNYTLQLNTTSAKLSSVGAFAPTNTQFVIGAGFLTGGATYVAYLFAHDTSADGIIQAGSFTTDASGNASVNLGWEPQYLMIKRVNTAEEWGILDTARGWTNNSDVNTDYRLYPNYSNVEAGHGMGHPTSTGFYASNLAASNAYIYLAIRRPNKPPTSGTQVYNAIARAGNDTLSTISGVGFAPDFVSVSKRTNVTNYARTIVDRLRGATGVRLWTERTDADWADPSSISGFTMNGMTLGIDGTVNNSSTTYINHFFKRAPWFFDQVSFKEDGSWNSQTVQHWLSVAPEMIIEKDRSQASEWRVYHKDINRIQTNPWLRLNGNESAWFTEALFPTTPTATSFSINYQRVNTQTHVAYLFATLPNISKVGSYTGSTSNVTVDCGFTASPPRFLMVKRTDSTGDWFVWDSARGFDKRLSLNTTAAEVPSDTSITTNNAGFVANTSGVVNGGTSARYIYLCVH